MYDFSQVNAKNFLIETGGGEDINAKHFLIETKDNRELGNDYGNPYTKEVPTGKGIPRILISKSKMINRLFIWKLFLVVQKAQHLVDSRVGYTRYLKGFCPWTTDSITEIQRISD